MADLTSVSGTPARSLHLPAFAGLSPAMAVAMQEALGDFNRVVGSFIGAQLKEAPVHAWQKFSTLGEPTQNAILGGIRAQTSFAQAAMDDGMQATNELAMLNWARARLGL